MIEHINKEDFAKITNSLEEYEQKLIRIKQRTYPLKAKVRIEGPQGQQLGVMGDEPFEIEVPFLLAVISGAKLFWNWLRKNYPDEKGGVHLNFGFRLDKYVAISIQAIKYLVIGLIKAIK